MVCKSFLRGRNAKLADFTNNTAYEPYATSHQALDKDTNLQTETRNATIALCEAVTALRAGKLVEGGRALTEPRPK